MSEHYFSERPGSESAPFPIEVRLGGRSATFLSDRGVFSAERLDTGSRLLAETVRAHRGETVLDLGCGIGILGILAALESEGSSILLDVNLRAVGLARGNAYRLGVGEQCLAVASDGADCLADASVDLVLLNPPIRAGRPTVTRLIADAGRVLRPGGRLGLVALTRQGAETLGRLTEQLVGPTQLAARGSGYRVWLATKG